MAYGNINHVAFGVAVLITFCGVIITLSGLASQQQFCNSNNPYELPDGTRTLGLVAGVRSAIRVQMASNYAGRSCATVFRYEWWGWALQMTFIAITGTIWGMGLVPKYKSALWGLGATVIVLSMQQANNLLIIRDSAEGQFKTRIEVSFSGYILFCIGAYLAMFAGCALYREVKEEREGKV